MSDVQNIKTENDNKLKLDLVNYFLDDNDKNWKKFDETENLFEYLNPVEEDFYLDKQNAIVHTRDVPFYKGVQLIRIANLYPEDEFTYFLAKLDDDYILLSGLSDYIFEINETGALKLNKDTIFDYLKFFCLSIRDEETMEPYYVIEGGSSEYLREFSPYQKKRALRNYKGPRIISSVGNNSFVVEARLLYGGHLFDARWKITPDGSVAMTDDKEVGAL